MELQFINTMQMGKWIRYFVFLMLISGLESSFGQSEKSLDKKIADDNTNDYYSANILNDLKFIVLETDYLIKDWVFISRKPDTPEKLRLLDYHHNVIPETIIKLNDLSAEWKIENLESFNKIKISIDTVMLRQRYIMDKLYSYGDYDDAFNQFECQGMILDNKEFREITDRIIYEIDSLKNYFALIIEESLINK